MKEKLPKNIQDLLNSVESKDNSGDVSSPEKESSMTEKEIADLKIEGLIGMCTNEKAEDTIKQLECLFKKYPEFKEKTEIELPKLIKDTVEKFNAENEILKKTEGGDPTKLHELGSKVVALKKIRDHFFKITPEQDEE